MMRFYGMTWDEVENMPCPKFNEYLMAMDTLEGKEALEMIEINSVPHIANESHRKKIFKKYQDKYKLHQEKKIMSPKDIERIIKNV